MTLPRAVQAQLDEAERLQQSLVAAAAPAQPPEAPQEPDPIPIPEIDTTPTPEPAPAPQARDDEDTWKQRYLSHQGRFDAAMAQATQAVRESRAEIDQLRAELAALKARPEPAPTPEPSVTPQDVERFGEDLIDLQSRVATKAMADARKVWSAERDALVRRIGELESRVGQVTETVGKSAHDRFYEQLDRVVPDWKTVNADPAWLAWLGQVDPMTGATRQSLLDAGAQALNAERVAAVFGAFRASTGRVPATEPPAPKPSAARALEGQVSPGKPKSTTSAAPEAKRLWTGKEIEKFYDDVVHRRIKPDDAARIEADINQAVAEGRVR